MWHTAEIVKILREYAINNEYSFLNNRKIAAALVADLLAPYEEEKRILTMLFREGISECLLGAPLSTLYEKQLAKNRVKNFVAAYGLNDEICENVTKILIDISVSEDLVPISIEYIIDQYEYVNGHAVKKQNNSSNIEKTNEPTVLEEFGTDELRIIEEFFEELFKEAYTHSAKRFNSRKRRNTLANSGESFVEIFQKFVNTDLLNGFMYAKRRFSIDFEKKILQYAQIKYQFIETAFCYKQLYREQLGMQQYFQEGVGKIIYLCHGIYCINVYEIKDAYESEVVCWKYTGAEENGSWYPYSYGRKLLDMLEEMDILKNRKLRIEIIDLYNGRNRLIRALALATAVAIASLDKNYIIPRNTFIAGMYNDKKNIAYCVLNEDEVALAKKNGAEKVLMITTRRKKSQTIDGLKIQYFRNTNDIFDI